MSFETKGFDELEKQFTQMQQGAKELTDTESVSFEDLFPSSFMEEHTNFLSFNKFLEAGKFIVNSQEDFEAIPDSELDSHVSKSTKFSSWEDMLGEATEEFTLDKLGL
ncbi:hypothetical protein [Clostridium tagluense]|uniref:hypothetical protein n=1 Tax=Clostridium tagluense TaxID=360422 RepID=UPI001C6DF7FD|nr:hypothetical protein [Clostridium tagluense]MBW9157236.1 hypothetical protein [Clostridium tagluense]WLC67164.1 hypothetical protein KTC93_08295 [Clostridium tagluense]